MTNWYDWAEKEASRHNARAVALGRPGLIDPSVIYDRVKKTGGRGEICGEHSLPHLHHIYPLSQGGASTNDNSLIVSIQYHKKLGVRIPTKAFLASIGRTLRKGIDFGFEKVVREFIGSTVRLSRDVRKLVNDHKASLEHMTGEPMKMQDVLLGLILDGLAANGRELPVVP